MLGVNLLTEQRTVPMDLPGTHSPMSAKDPQCSANVRRWIHPSSHHDSITIVHSLATHCSHRSTYLVVWVQGGRPDAGSKPVQYLLVGLPILDNKTAHG